MDTQQETILQAVILADPFEHQSRYGPLIRGGGQDGEGGEDAQPWSLLPFCNAPLIAWTLESLSASNVQKAFIVIREGAKELQEWLDSSTYMAPTASMSIRIRQTQAYSEGDVMREVDGLALTGDWLLVRAGYMGNLDLQTAVESFTARRKKEQGLLMECLVSQRKTKSPSAKVSTHILTPQKDLVHFTHHSRFPRRRRAHFPLELLEDDKEALGRELAIRTDLESIGVDICNMEVPALFVENFDYQNMRPDFINGVLTSDLLGKTIRCTVIGEGRNGASGDVGACNARAVPWAAHVGDLASYAQISKAVISRWSYPLTPDEMIPGTSSRYEQRRSRLYVGKRLHLARSCTVGAASIIGHGSSIGDHSTVSHSVIGENCRIAANVRITNSFIFEGAIIEDGCTVRDSVVSQGVRIKKGSEMAGGTLIGPGVIIGDGASLFASRAAAQPWDEEASSEDTRVAAHANGSGPLGSGSRGHLWPSEVDVFEAEDADSDDEDGHDVRNLKISSLRVVDADEAAGYHSATSSGSTISRSSSSSSFASDASGASSRASGMADPPAIAGIGALMSNDDSAAAADAAFERECTSSLERSFSEGHTVENAAIELKTLRMASNVPLRQVVSVVVPFMCRQVQGKLGASAAPAEVSRAVNGLVERWGDLVASLTGGQESGQVEALLFLQEHCAAGEDDGSAHARLFPAFLQAYYQEDVVSEEAVRSWVTSPKAKSNGGSTGTKLWQTGAAFMRALMEAEDSDEEEEDDDDSE